MSRLIKTWIYHYNPSILYEVRLFLESVTIEVLWVHKCLYSTRLCGCVCVCVFVPGWISTWATTSVSKSAINKLKQTEAKLKPNFALKSLHLCVTGLGLSGHCVCECVFEGSHAANTSVLLTSGQAQHWHGSKMAIAGAWQGHPTRATPSWSSKNRVCAAKGHTLTSALQATLPQHRPDWHINISLIVVTINTPLEQLVTCDDAGFMFVLSDIVWSYMKRGSSGLRLLALVSCWALAPISNHIAGI